MIKDDTQFNKLHNKQS